MLEVMAVYYLCKRNIDNAKARGRKSGGVIAYTICLWLGFEIVGAFLGAFLATILGMGDGTIIMYLLALVFAGLGGLISNLISKAGPITVVQQIPTNYYQTINPSYPYPIQPINPYQCQRCGNINPSDSLFCMKCGNPLQINQQAPGIQYPLQHQPPVQSLQQLPPMQPQQLPPQLPPVYPPQLPPMQLPPEQSSVQQEEQILEETHIDEENMK